MNFKKALLVLGMHRSGTSILTKILNLLGAGVPQNLMPTTSDNPIGYFESEPIAQFNNELLKASGNTWKTYAPISGTFFNYLNSGEYQKRAIELIKQEYGASTLIALKCPRICRLFPFWEQVLIEAGYEIHPILILRNVREVYQSLAARAFTPSFSPASIVQQEHAVLLWLRYIIDSERYTRNKHRYVIQYTDIISDWYVVLSQLTTYFNVPLNIHSEDIIYEISSLLRPEMRRRKLPDEYKLIQNDEVFVHTDHICHKILNVQKEKTEVLDHIKNQLDLLFNGWNADQLTSFQDGMKEKIYKKHFDLIRSTFEELN